MLYTAYELCHVPVGQSDYELQKRAEIDVVYGVAGY